MQAALVGFFVAGLLVCGADFQEVTAGGGPGNVHQSFLVAGHGPVFLAVAVAGTAGDQFHFQVPGGLAIHQQAPLCGFPGVQVIGVGKEFDLEPFAGGGECGGVGRAQGDHGFQPVMGFHHFYVAGVGRQFLEHFFCVIAPGALALAVHFVHQEKTGLGDRNAVAALLLQLHIKHAARVHAGGVIHCAQLAIRTGDFECIDRVGALEAKDFIGNTGIHRHPLRFGYGGMTG